MAGAVERRKMQSRRDLVLAWNAEALHRVPRLPPIEDLLAEGELPDDPNERMFLIARRWNAAVNMKMN